MVLKKIADFETISNWFGNNVASSVNSQSGDVSISTTPQDPIFLWPDLPSTIPSGWVLCNGGNGTPDLRDKFVTGSGNSYSVGDTGGTNSVQLTVAELPSHDHDYRKANFSYSRGDNNGKRGVGSSSVNTSKTGSGDGHENRPEYQALCYIMKS